MSVEMKLTYLLWFEFEKQNKRKSSIGYEKSDLLITHMDNEALIRSELFLSQNFKSLTSTVLTTRLDILSPTLFWFEKGI